MDALEGWMGFKYVEEEKKKRLKILGHVQKSLEQKVLLKGIGDSIAEMEQS